jgi:hypothetical protein
LDFEEFASAAMPGLLRFGHVLTGDPLRAHLSPDLETTR